MTNALTELLSERDWLLLDGATGTNLFAMGLEAGEADADGNYPQQSFNYLIQQRIGKFQELRRQQAREARGESS